MNTQSLVKKRSNQCYLLLSYELPCSFPWLVVLEYIFWGAFTSTATLWFGLKIPEVTNLFITFNWKHNSYVRANYVSKKRTILNIYIYIYVYIYRPVETEGAGGEGCSPPRFLLPCIFHKLKKIVLKWKNSIKLKTSWNSSRVTDISNITIDLDTRDGIPSVINCERFSHF